MPLEESHTTVEWADQCERVACGMVHSMAAEDCKRVAHALSGGAVGGARSVSEGEVGALAALNDLEGGASLSDDGGGDGGGKALTFKQSLSDGLHAVGVHMRRDTSK